MTVTNTGDTAGKAVIELYAQTPYGDYEKTNLVEKSAIQLVAFDKTKLLAPGASETRQLEVDKYFLTAYDSHGAKGYILSEGTYYLSLGDDAHDALNNVLACKNASGLTAPDGSAVAGIPRRSIPGRKSSTMRATAIPSPGRKSRIVLTTPISTIGKAAL